MERKKAKHLELAVLFALGATIYCTLEVLWRGHSHWSMALAGGVSLCGLAKCRDRLWHRPLWLRCVLGAGLITLVEFLTGCIVNLWLGLQVWDYSGQRGNLLGQICPQFFLLWTLLCLPAFGLCRMVRTLREVLQDQLPADAV